MTTIEPLNITPHEAPKKAKIPTGIFIGMFLLLAPLTALSLKLHQLPDPKRVHFARLQVRNEDEAVITHSDGETELVDDINSTIIRGTLHIHEKDFDKTWEDYGHLLIDLYLDEKPVTKILSGKVFKDGRFVIDLIPEEHIDNETLLVKIYETAGYSDGLKKPQWFRVRIPENPTPELNAGIISLEN